MRNRIVFFILLLSTFSCLVFAENKSFGADNNLLQKEDILKNSDDFAAANELEAKITDSIISLMKSVGVDLEKPVVVDYDNAMKVYNDCNIFEAGTNDETSIMQVASSGHYAWELPAYSDGLRFRVVLAKGLPLSENGRKNLTEDEQKSITDNVGKLSVFSLQDMQQSTNLKIRLIHTMMLRNG